MDAKAKAIKVGKWIGRNLLLALGTCFIFLLALEVVYRYNWFDFYSNEIELLNAPTKNKKSSTTILVLGDSFTASINSYVSSLNDSLSDVRFINSGVPGFGIQEIATLTSGRIEEYKPDAVILQLYVGNDLIDLQRPVNWSTVSLPRNIYWSLADHFLSIRYINYKLGQFKEGTALATEQTKTKLNSVFDSAHFSTREKILIAADPSYLRKSILASEDFAPRYNEYANYLDEVTSMCESKKIPMYIVLIPSACQVTKSYQEHEEELGASFGLTNMQDTLYPFFIKLLNKLEGRATVLSPLSYFQELEGSGIPLYFQNDIHLNATGQLELAHFISRKINFKTLK